jgi:hypothetical protein
MKKIMVICSVLLLLMALNALAQDVSIDGNGNVTTGVINADGGNLEVTGILGEDAIRGSTSGAGSAGVYGENTSNGVGVYGYSSTGDAGYFQGNTRVTGNLTVTGSINNSGLGTVTQINTGSGLQGGPITASGTVDLKLNISGGLSKTLGTGSDELGVAAGGITSFHIQDYGILFSDLGQNGCASNEGIVWNGSAWACTGSPLSLGSHITSLDGLSGGTVTGDVTIDGDVSFGIGAGGQTMTFGNAGNDSSVFNGAVFFNDEVRYDWGSATERMTLYNSSTSSGTYILGIETTGAGSTFSDGIRILSSGTGIITDGIDVSDAEIINAINIGSNNIAGTNFNLDGATGTVTAAFFSGNVTSSATISLNTTASTISGRIAYDAVNDRIAVGDGASVDYFYSGPHTVETDPIFSTSPAQAITSGQITDWNTAFSWGNHALAGYDTSNDAWTGTGNIYTTSGNVGIGTTNPSENLHIIDSPGATGAWATGSDLLIDSGASQRYITLRGPISGQTGILFSNSDSFLDGGIRYFPSSTAGADRLEIRSGNTTGINVMGDGKVGIGTTSPSETLEVSGITQTIQLKAGDGEAAAPSYTFSGDNNTGIYRPAADSISLSTSGAERARIDSSGNFGIGTTTPTEKLDVNGNARVTGDLVVDGKISSSGTKSLVVGADEVTAQPNSDLNIHYAGLYAYINSSSGTGYPSYMHIPLKHIPDDAYVTGISCTIYDNSTTAQMAFGVFEVSTSGSSNTKVGWCYSGSSGGCATSISYASTSVNTLSPTVTPFTIDRSNYSYNIAVWTSTGTCGSNCKLHSCKITYTE